MVAYLKGRILEKGLAYLIVENNGVGYKVFVTSENLSKQVGEEIALFTYHKFSDDGQALFGLPDFETLQFFELLVTVSGVGPKVALAILSSARVDAVKQAIANQDVGIFTRIAGVGTKTAEKIIVELKSKVGQVGGGQWAVGSEVFDALLALGYNQRAVREAVQKVDANLPQEQQLKEALRILGKH